MHVAEALIFGNLILHVARYSGVPRGAPGTLPLGVQILSFSCSFRSWSTPSGKSWIRHWDYWQFITSRQRSGGKVMFLHLRVILFTGGCMMSLSVLLPGSMFILVVSLHSGVSIQGSLSRGGVSIQGGCLPPGDVSLQRGRQTDPLQELTSSGSHQRGWYASYSNAYLFRGNFCFFLCYDISLDFFCFALDGRNMPCSS